MNRLQTYYEQLQLPLKSLFFGSALIALGALIQNPYLNNVLMLDNSLLVTLSTIALTSGGIILSYFPIYVFIKLLSHEKNEPNIVVTGMMSYLVFLGVMLLLSPTTSEPATYLDYFSFQINGKIHLLYHTGIFGILGIFLVVRYIYRKTPEKRRASQVSYIDRETNKLVASLFASGVLGALFAFGWPVVIDSIYSMMEFISNDVNNPMSLFAYGALERLMALANLEAILHQEFWLNALGGTWMNIAGETFTGDVNIWTAQMRETLNVFGGGRFTSASFIMNLFAIPGYLVAIWSILTNKRVRTRNLTILIAAIVISMLGGILLPIELLMILTSPTVYFFHLFMTSFVYAIMSGFQVALGFSYLGNLTYATPGTLPDLLGISQNSVLFSKIMIMLLVGVIVFFIYLAFTRFYYETMALDILSVSNNKQRVQNFVESLGGIDNIETISSSITRIHLELTNRDELNVASLHRQGVTRIVETRQGFVLSLGSSAFMIQKAVNKELKTRPVLEQEEAIDG